MAYRFLQISRHEDIKRPFWELLQVPREYLDLYLDMVEVEDQVRAMRAPEQPNMP